MRLVDCFVARAVACLACALIALGGCGGSASDVDEDEPGDSSGDSSGDDAPAGTPVEYGVLGLEGSGGVLTLIMTHPDFGVEERDYPLTADGAFNTADQPCPGACSLWPDGRFPADTAVRGLITQQPGSPAQQCIVEPTGAQLIGTPLQVDCTSAAIQYTVKGLEGTGGDVLLVLTHPDIGVEERVLPLTANGTFSTADVPCPDCVHYPTGRYPPGTIYRVLADTLPTEPAQTCRVTPSGPTTPETPFEVDCTSAPIRYVVTGLDGSGGELLIVVTHPEFGVEERTYSLTADGAFTTAQSPCPPGGDCVHWQTGRYPPDAAYRAIIQKQPTNPDQQCRAESDARFVAEELHVNCGDASISYTVEGLSGDGLAVGLSTEVENNGTTQMAIVESQPVSEDGVYTFDTLVSFGKPYRVTVLEHPINPSQECLVENGEGVAQTDVDDVIVKCGEAYREFRFDNSMSRAQDAPLLSGAQTGGVLYRQFVFGPGPAVSLGSFGGFGATDLFRLHIDPRGADGAVYSNKTGKTFWLIAESPNGAYQPQPAGNHSNFSKLDTWWRFRKVSEETKFQLEVTEVFMLAFDDTHAEEAAGRLWAGGDIWVRAFADTGAEDMDEFFSINGGMFLEGKLDGSGSVDTHWSLRGSISADAEYALWAVNDFTLDPMHAEPLGKVAFARLSHPIPIEIDLSSLPVGAEFYVYASSEVEARNSYSPEGGATVFLRDPATFVAGDPNDPAGLDDQGGGMRVTDMQGVMLIPMEDVPSSRVPEAGPAPAACDPLVTERSVLQFEEPEYLTGEGGEPAPLIRIMRTGASSGLVTARVSLSGETATANADFQAREIEVRFGDGSDAPRTITLPIIDDEDIETDETLTLTLQDAQGCAVIGAQGASVVTIADDDTPVQGPASYTIGGVVTGLAGSGLVLTNNSTDDLTVDANGPFSFSPSYPNGAIYTVRVASQPTNPGQVCTVTNGSGTVAEADVTDIEVSCEMLAPPSGALDPEFGLGGIVSSASLAGVLDLALQSDGKLVLASRRALTRYDADGQVDPGFGGGGVTPIEFFGLSYDSTEAVAVQPDGSIIVAGHARTAANSPTQDDFVAARFTADGALDSGFGTGGILATDFDTRGDFAYNVLVASDGGVVLTGSGAIRNSFGIAGSNFAAARYTSTGAPDLTFGDQGRVYTDIAGETDLGYASALQSDGKIVIAGRVAPSGGADPDVGLVRYNADGSADVDFGASGIVRPMTIEWDEAAEVLVQPDGKIVVVGHFIDVSTPMLLIERYNSDGSPDTSFGSSGRFIDPMMDVGRAVAIDAVGRIIVAGRRAGNFAITRLDAFGAVDSTFGTDGLVEVDFFGGSDTPEAIVVQSNGMIVVAGSVTNGTATQMGMARIAP